MAYAETLAAGEVESLAWMDSNTLMVNEPKEFLLPAEKQLGCCPVHLLILGSRFNQPLDPFWTQN